MFPASNGWTVPLRIVAPKEVGCNGTRGSFEGLKVERLNVGNSHNHAFLAKSAQLLEKKKVEFLQVQKSARECAMLWKKKDLNAVASDEWRVGVLVTGNPAPLSSCKRLMGHGLGGGGRQKDWG
jgi:hypothetical protein